MNASVVVTKTNRFVMKIKAVVTNVKALVMNASVVVTKTNRFVMNVEAVVTNVEAVVIYKVQIPDF